MRRAPTTPRSWSMKRIDGAESGKPASRTATSRSRRRRVGDDAIPRVRRDRDAEHETDHACQRVLVVGRRLSDPRHRQRREVRGEVAVEDPIPGTVGGTHVIDMP